MAGALVAAGFCGAVPGDGRHRCGGSRLTHHRFYSHGSLGGCAKLPAFVPLAVESPSVWPLVAPLGARRLCQSPRQVERNPHDDVEHHRVVHHGVASVGCGDGRRQHAVCAGMVMATARATLMGRRSASQPASQPREPYSLKCCCGRCEFRTLTFCVYNLRLVPR